MRKFLTAGVALAALTAGAAQAQVQSGPGFFGTIDGMYAIKNNAGGTAFLDNVDDDRATPGGGLGGALQLGYRFEGAWDIALGGRYIDFKRGDTQSANGFSTRITDAKVWNVDLDAGYTISGPGYGVRPFIGLRYQRATYDISDAVLALATDVKAWGVGPRIGVDGSLRLTESISLFGGIDTAFLFGKIKSPGLTGVGRPGDSRSRMFWDIGAKAGLDWEVAPLFHIAAGYRVEWLDGVAYSFTANNGAPGGGPQGRSGFLNHGPFVRLAYNWGAPPSGAAPMQPPPAGKKSYIVFFDFDRAVITPTAATTIKQAAADAKAGKSTRLDVTGHADKSGGDAYNMALSLRRGNAVKDQLVREGIPAAQIAVVGRGESMPLVQTADGVREPQNRRVEIVIN